MTTGFQHPKNFGISDIVLRSDLPASLRQAAEMYAGCVSGAILQDDYLRYIQEAGFTTIVVQKEKAIYLPNDLLSNYLSADAIAAYRSSTDAIISITVYAEKPGSTPEASPKLWVQLADLTQGGSCVPGGGCC